MANNDEDYDYGDYNEMVAQSIIGFLKLNNVFISSGLVIGTNHMGETEIDIRDLCLTKKMTEELFQFMEKAFMLEIGMSKEDQKLILSNSKGIESIENCQIPVLIYGGYAHVPIGGKIKKYKFNILAERHLMMVATIVGANGDCVTLGCHRMLSEYGDVLVEDSEPTPINLDARANMLNDYIRFMQGGLLTDNLNVGLVHLLERGELRLTSAYSEGLERDILSDVNICTKLINNVGKKLSYVNASKYGLISDGIYGRIIDTETKMFKGMEDLFVFNLYRGFISSPNTDSKDCEFFEGGNLYYDITNETVKTMMDVMYFDGFYPIEFQESYSITRESKIYIKTLS